MFFFAPDSLLLQTVGGFASGYCPVPLFLHPTVLPLGQIDAAIAVLLSETVSLNAFITSLAFPLFIFSIYFCMSEADMVFFFTAFLIASRACLSSVPPANNMPVARRIAIIIFLMDPLTFVIRLSRYQVITKNI